jgi:ActR/RegA family two-component response regulator
MPMNRELEVTVRTKLRDSAVRTNDGAADTEGMYRPPPPPGSVLRLLHIEDNESDALLTETYIRSVIPDVEFDSASRMSEVTSERVAAASCAILDLSLPDASGLEALHALRQISADVPIIVLTGFDDLETGLSAIRHGAEDYLVKNYVDGDSLQRALRYAMERRRLTSALENQRASRPVEHTGVRSNTHQVSIDVDVETSVFSLHCHTCSWEAESDLASLSSWGHLERILLPHVAFGGNAQPSIVLETTEGTGIPREHETFTPGTWLG